MSRLYLLRGAKAQRLPYSQHTNQLNSYCNRISLTSSQCQRKLRYESSTSTSQELSRATKFHSLWVSLLGIRDTWPDFHFFNIQGAFFNCSALKMTKCQPDGEIWELFLSKKRLRMKKVKVPELLRTVPLPKMTKENSSGDWSWQLRFH